MADAEKLLSRMRASKSGWGEKDLRSLYFGFGFQLREGGKHCFYFHPKYPQLYATVARHDPLAIGYVATAIKLIDQLKKMESSDE